MPDPGRRRPAARDGAAAEAAAGAAQDSTAESTCDSALDPEIEQYLRHLSVERRLAARTLAILSASDCTQSRPACVASEARASVGSR